MSLEEREGKRVSEHGGSRLSKVGQSSTEANTSPRSTAQHLHVNRSLARLQLALQCQNALQTTKRQVPRRQRCVIYQFISVFSRSTRPSDTLRHDLQKAKQDTDASESPSGGELKKDGEGNYYLDVSDASIRSMPAGSVVYTLDAVGKHETSDNKRVQGKRVREHP